MKYVYLLVFLLFSNTSFACKERASIDQYPLDELRQDSFLIEAKVTNLINSTSGRYPFTKSFDAEILQSYKGDLKAGQVIKVLHAEEDTHAVCPVSLKENGVYIFVVNKRDSVFEVSRFNVILNAERENYKRLKSQIEASRHTENSCEYPDVVKLAETLFKQHKEFYAQNLITLNGLLSAEFAESLTREFNCVSQGEICAIDFDPWTGAQDGEIKEPINFIQTGKADSNVTVDMSYLYVLSESQQQTQRVSMAFIKDQSDSCWLLDDFIMPDNASLKKQLKEWHD